MFPTERAAILETLRSTARRLSEDQTSIEGIPPSPVVGANGHPERLDFPKPSPNMLPRNEEHSPSMDSIPEEQGYQEELLANLPEHANNAPDFEGVGNGAIEELENETSSVKVETVAEAVIPEPPPTPIEPTQTNPEDQTDGLFIAAKPVTPVIHDNGEQLGAEQNIPSKGEEVVSPKTGPSIMIEAATPSSSLRTRGSEQGNKPVDTAKSTAIEEENDRGQLTSRRPSSPLPERPLTPASMRSAGKDAKSKNFLKNFLKLVFVDWIGGFFRRLCGGRRHT